VPIQLITGIFHIFVAVSTKVKTMNEVKLN